VHAVVVAHCCRVLVAEGVEDAHGVGLVHPVGDLVVGGPAEGGCFVGDGEVSPGDLAALDEGDHVAGHELVDAGVPAPEVARRACHGVTVLLRVYAGLAHMQRGV
jgi:hypothetical protein